MSVEENIHIREEVDSLLSLVSHLHGNPLFYRQMEQELRLLKTVHCRTPDIVNPAKPINPKVIGSRVMELASIRDNGLIRSLLIIWSGCRTNREH